MSDDDYDPRQLCCLVSQANGEPAAGSAPCHDRFLLLELPAPWAGKINRTEHFPTALAKLEAQAVSRGAPYRLQALLPDPEHSLPGFRRVVLFERPEPPCARYHRFEYLVPEEHLGGLGRALLLDPEGLGEYAEWRVEHDDLRDLLLCVHGEHDACCGRFGKELYEALRYEHATGERALRVWRTSHLGGHRFAPTLLDLPSGRYWGRMTPEKLDALVGFGPLTELIDGYRGWTALRTAVEQVAEAEALRRFGWSWAAADKRSRVLEQDSDRGAARIRLEASGSLTLTAEVTVERSGKVMTLNSSGSGPLAEVQTYAVTTFQQLR